MRRKWFALKSSGLGFFVAQTLILSMHAVSLAGACRPEPSASLPAPGTKAAALPEAGNLGFDLPLVSAVTEAAAQRRVRMETASLSAVSQRDLATLLAHAPASGLCVSVGGERPLIVSPRADCAQLVVADRNLNVVWYHRMHGALLRAAYAQGRGAQGSGERSGRSSERDEVVERASHPAPYSAPYSATMVRDAYRHLRYQAPAEVWRPALFSQLDMSAAELSEEQSALLFAWWQQWVRSAKSVYLPLLEGDTTWRGYLFEEQAFAQHFLPLYRDERVRALRVNWRGGSPHMASARDVGDRFLYPRPELAPLALLDLSSALSQGRDLHTAEGLQQTVIDGTGVLEGLALLVEDAVEEGHRPLLLLSHPVAPPASSPSASVPSASSPSGSVSRGPVQGGRAAAVPIQAGSAAQRERFVTGALDLASLPALPQSCLQAFLTELRDSEVPVFPQPFVCPTLSCEDRR